MVLFDCFLGRSGFPAHSPPMFFNSLVLMMTEVLFASENLWFNVILLLFCPLRFVTWRSHVVTFVVFMNTITVSFTSWHVVSSVVLELDCMVLGSLGNQLKLIQKYGNRQEVLHWRLRKDYDSSSSVEMVLNFFKTIEHLSRQMLMD